MVYSRSKILQRSDRAAHWNFRAVCVRLSAALVLLAVIPSVSCMSSAGQKSDSTRTMTIHVEEACESSFVTDATVEVFDPSTAKRRVLGYTDGRGTVTVTFGADVTTLLVCKKYYYCVAIFPPSLRGVEETDVALPRWSIR